MPNYRMVKESTQIAPDPKNNVATWTPTGEVFPADTQDAAQARIVAKRIKYPDRKCYACEFLVE